MPAVNTAPAAGGRSPLWVTRQAGGTPGCARTSSRRANGIHIIDLEQTQKQLDVACEYLRDIVGSGQKVLFVGTKKQARTSSRRSAGTPAGLRHAPLDGRHAHQLPGHPAPPAPARRAPRHASRRATSERMSGRRPTTRRMTSSASRTNFAGMADMKRLPGAVLCDRLQEGTHRGHRGQQAEHPDCRHRRHELRPRRHPGRDPGNDDAMRSCRLIVSEWQGDRRGLQQFSERELQERQEAEQRERDAAIAAEAAAVVAAEQAAAAAAHADAIAAEQAAAAPAEEPARSVRRRPMGRPAADGRGHSRNGQGLARAHRRGHDGLQTCPGRVRRRHGQGRGLVASKGILPCSGEGRTQHQRGHRRGVRPPFPADSPSRAHSSRSTASRTSSPKTDDFKHLAHTLRAPGGRHGAVVRPARGRARGTGRA